MVRHLSGRYRTILTDVLSGQEKSSVEISSLLFLYLTGSIDT